MIESLNLKNNNNLIFVNKLLSIALNSDDIANHAWHFNLAYEWPMPPNGEKIDCIVKSTHKSHVGHVMLPMLSSLGEWT